MKTEHDGYWKWVKASMLVVACVLLASGCGKHPTSQKHEILTDKERQLVEWSLQAREDVPRALTNDIIGFTRMIECDLDARDPSPTNWTANVTAEYINHVGGVDRTNLPYKFYFSILNNYIKGKAVIITNVAAIMDYSKHFQQEMQEIKDAK